MPSKTGGCLAVPVAQSPDLSSSVLSNWLPNSTQGIKFICFQACAPQTTLTTVMLCLWPVPGACVMFDLPVGFTVRSDRLFCSTRQGNQARFLRCTLFNSSPSLIWSYSSEGYHERQYTVLCSLPRKDLTHDLYDTASLKRLDRNSFQVVSAWCTTANLIRVTYCSPINLNCLLHITSSSRNSPF